MIDGIINIYKEKGYTSHDVGAILRGILHQKKIGHTGTLDPDAEGVLPVCLGRATKLCELLTDKEKVYRAGLLLGMETDTQDISGRVLAQRQVTTGEAAFRAALTSMIGEINQIPPMYSAIKVNGKKLYELARAGKTIERAPRRIRIYDIEPLSVELPRATLRVRCSKGTYIRTLCHDIGSICGCGGVMTSLVREISGIFSLEDSLTLDQVRALHLSGELPERIRTLSDTLSDYPAFICNEAHEKALLNGNRLLPDWGRAEKTAGKMRVFTQDGRLVGLYEWRGEALVPSIMLLTGANE